VVISPLPEYEPMRDVLRIARTRDDFIRLVEEALHDNDPRDARTTGCGRFGNVGRARRVG
jgi:hypothetical protein